MKTTTPYSAEAFNDAIRWLRRCFPIAGPNVELEYLAGQGIRVHARTQPDPPRHPWRIRCFTAPDTSGAVQWRAEITPGFVNGRDASIVTRTETGDVAAALTDDPRPSLPLGGWRNPLASGAPTARGESLISARGEGYPRFFESIGVAAPAPGGDAFRDTSSQSPAIPGRTRQLRALDVFLQMPRLAIAQQVTIGTQGDSQAVVIDSVFLNAAVRDAAAPARILATPKWSAPAQPTAMDRFTGALVEPQTDELLLATVWIVSPPDADPQAAPDATWTPYPQHFVFWNLCHASRNQVPAAPQKPITLRTGLIGGIADQIFADLLAPTNDQYAQLAAFLGAGDFSGQFWT